MRTRTKKEQSLAGCERLRGGHFVQYRMERNGMRWSINGAKNILNLRSVNKNKNWDDYIQYYIKKKQDTIEDDYFRMSA